MWWGRENQPPSRDRTSMDAEAGGEREREREREREICPAALPPREERCGFAGRADWGGRGGAARGGSKERGDGILGRKGSGGRSFPGGYLDNQPRDDAWRGIIYIL